MSTATVLVVPTGATTKPHEGENDSSASTAGVATDGTAGVLIARPTAVLRFAEADGLVTVAGAMSESSAGVSRGGGTTGDGGPLGSARFTRIVAMTADAAGNVYVADEVDSRMASIAIRFLNRGLEPVTFYAGTGHQLTVARGTVATIAGASPGDALREAVERKLTAAAPTLAVASDRLYLGSTVLGQRRRAQVRVLNLGGTELAAHGTTVAPGALATVATVVGAAGATASVAALAGMASDSEGNLLLAERSNHRVRRVDRSGAVTTYAGTGAAGFNGNDRPATTARLDEPYDVEIGASGRVYISDAGNAQVRFVDQAGIIHAALGNGTATSWRCSPGHQSATTSGAASSGNPSSLAADEHGNMFLGSENLARVYRLAPSGRLRPVVGRSPSTCGQPGECEGTKGAPATIAGLVRPDALAVRPGGGLYLLDGTRVRFVNLAGRSLRIHGVLVAPGAMHTVAELTSDYVPPSGSTGAPRSGLVTSRGALAADRMGNLFIAEAGPSLVRQTDARGVTTALVAGPPARPGGTSGPDRCCTRPGALALDGAGNLYIADLRELGQVWFLNRGAATVMAHGVKVDPGGLEPVAGSGEVGVRDDGGPALETQLGIPSGIALDRSGNLYVVDHLESTVRRVDKAGVITTVVGTGGPGFNGDGLKGALTALQRPTQLAVDACGNLIIADTGNDRVRRLNLFGSCPGDRHKPGTSTNPGPGAVVPLAAVALVGTVLVAGRLAWRGRGPARTGPS